MLTKVVCVCEDDVSGHMGNSDSAGTGALWDKVWDVKWVSMDIEGSAHIDTCKSDICLFM